MGFFDNLLNLNQPQTDGILGAAAALLQAGGSSRTPTSFGQGLGSALTAFQQNYQASQQAQQQQALRDLQIKSAQGELDDKAVARKDALDARNFYLKYNQPGQSDQPSQTDIARSILGNDLRPTLANAAKLGAAQPTDGATQAATQPDLYTQKLRQAQAMRLSGNPVLIQQADALEKNALAFRDEYGTDFHVAQGPDGQLHNYLLSKYGPPKDSGLAVAPKLEFRDGGGLIYGLDGNTGKVMSTLKKTQSPDSIAADRRAAADRANGPDVDPNQVENVAQLIASGRMAPLTSMAMRSPFGASVMSRVAEINPQFDGTTYGTTSKAARDFATGKQGNSVRSFNVSISHLDTLGQLADALGNGNTQAINKLGNAYASQTGSAAPTNFEAAKKIVADEVIKAIVGSGGGVHDREEAARTIDAANSPAQLKGVIRTYQDLMVGQLGGLEQQYRTTTGRDDFNKYLSPQAQAMFHPTGKAATPTAPAAAGVKFLGFE